MQLVNKALYSALYQDIKQLTLPFNSKQGVYLCDTSIFIDYISPIHMLNRLNIIP